jgi:hypothetical protein
MRLSVNKLREIYRERGVKRKMLRETKLVTKEHLKRIDADARKAY